VRSDLAHSPLAHEIVRRAARLDVTPPPGARARVWHALEERRRREHERPSRRRLGGAMFAAGAACAAVIAAATMMLSPRPHATVLIIASSSQPATLDLGGDGRVVAGPATRARLARQDGAVTLTLEKGSLLAHVLPRGQRAPFVVKTASFSARVVGTVLRVVAHDDGVASIAVGHGSVEVTPRGQPLLVLHAGERWPAGSRDAPDGDELERMGPGHLEGVAAASLSPSLPAPASAAASAGEPCPRRHGESAVQCWLDVADHTGDAARAESALYQAGFIRMHELGDPAFALGIWERQRQRFPRGLLRDEAHTSIIDALVALGRSRAAEGEIADYLKQHPGGLRSAEMHFVRGTLYHAEDGSCRRAARELDLALARPAAPWAERARTARAACAR
jgi:FecR-like protein